jgi:hypothetical protein
MNVGQKADYVRDKIRSDARRGHKCHWPGCEKDVPPAQWGCRQHWFKLPLSLRNRIWLTFRPGQEESKTPSRDYVAVAKQVQEWIAAQGGA